MEYRCNECKQKTQDYYMLQDELWSRIAKPREKTLCLACVKKRLGRKLKKADFQKVPINYIKGHLPYESSPVETRKAILGWWIDEANADIRQLKKELGMAEEALSWMMDEFEKYPNPTGRKSVI